MRYAVLGLCVFATACAGQGLTSPMSPSISIGGAAVTEAHDASELPFKGTLETVESITGSPPVLQDVLTGTGQATHLGRFTATFTYDIHLEELTSNGFFTLIAANGDSIFTDFVGQGNPIEGSDFSFIVETNTITGGTGRFAGATGSFTVERLLNRVTGVSSGSFDGTIEFGKAK